MRRVRSQFLQSALGRLGFAVRGREVSRVGAVASSAGGIGAPSVAGTVDRHSARIVLAAALLTAAFAAVLPSFAAAAPMANLNSCGTPQGAQGGQLQLARGVAANQSGNGAPAGSIYVAEGNPNHRISQFTADCEFVRMWGFDVVTSGSPNDSGTGFEICDVTNGNVASQCQTGLTGAAAGQLANPSGISVDQTNGYLYVTSQTNRRVDVFTGTGQFVGAFGWGVDTGAAELEFCNTQPTKTCQVAGAAGSDAGRFGALNPSVPAVDPSVPGRVYVPDPANRRVAQYSTTVTGGDLTAVTFDKAFGHDVIPGGGTGLESCTTVTTCQAGLAGGGAGQFSAGSTAAVAVDSTGAIYVVSVGAGTCAVAAPCRVQKFAPDASSAIDFGPVSGPGQLTFTSGLASAVAPISAAINPSNDHVFVQRRESATSYRVVEFDSAGVYVETHPSGDALPTAAPNNNNPGIAVGAGGRVYTILGSTGSWPVFVLGSVPPATCTVNPVTDIESSTATFNGTVTIPAPGSPAFTTKYRFEYSKDGVSWTSFPETDADVGDGTTGTHSVSQAAVGLGPNTVYQVRMVATTSESTTCGPTTFTTPAVAPTVSKLYAMPIGDTTATLRGTVNPNNSPTNYQFEYGTTTGYGTDTPSFQPYIGDGGTDQKVTSAIGDLAPDTTYHYRLIATNETGITYGPDRTFTTHRCPDTNTAGLGSCRAYELVSPADLGPVALSGATVNAFYEGFSTQVGVDGGSVAYLVGYGLPGATTGGDATYQADRGEGGWQSSQLTPAVDGPVTTGGDVADNARVLYLSEDLDCGFVVSHQQLAADAPTETTEAGGLNLFRRNPDGSYTTITTEVPANLAVPSGGLDTFQDVTIMGASRDCGRVVFMTYKRYASAGYSPTAKRQLYEWDHGELRAVGVVPGASDPVSPAIPGFDSLGSGAAFRPTDYFNAVSDDGTRAFFSATRAASSLAGEIGMPGLFVREDGATTVDVSLSETGVVSRGARFQDAAEDGSKVFFLANYGLAAGSDSSGVTTSDCTSPVGGAANELCDLYVYDVETDDLTSLSATTAAGNPDGAVVAGVLDSSDDGETVYFAAKGRLVPREGNTYAENTAGAGAFNVYRAHGGDLSFVAVVTPADLGVGGLLTSPGQIAQAFARWSSRSTPDGDHLLFQSNGNVAGYDSGGVVQAYRYSAESETTVCVSCRDDGQPPAGTGDAYDHIKSLASGRSTNYDTYHSPTRTISDDGSHAVFWSLDALAPGAVNGEENYYEWHDGQVSLIVTHPRGPLSALKEIGDLGITPDGGSVFFSTKARLVPQDYDNQRSLYVVRTDGGFDAPSPPVSCDPLVAGSCQSGGQTEAAPSLETLSPAADIGGPAARQTVRIAGVSRKSRSRVAITGVLPVRVSASAAGRVVVTARGRVGRRVLTVSTASVRVREPGPGTVSLRLNAVAKRKLRSGKPLRLTIVARQAGARQRSIGVLLPGARS